MMVCRPHDALLFCIVPGSSGTRSFTGNCDCSAGFLHSFFCSAQVTVSARSYIGKCFSLPSHFFYPFVLCSPSAFRHHALLFYYHSKSSPQVTSTVSAKKPRGLAISDQQTAHDTKHEILNLGADGDVYRKTLRLVECAMFAAVAGLAYLVSSSLSVEKYFSFFFAFPIVVSSLRWGPATGRKTVVATSVLLLTLAGPVKTSTYLLMHGLLGLAIGTLWSLQVNWILSILLCSLVRATGAVGYILISSFLIRENILSLIAINIHASLSLMHAILGINTTPSLSVIYVIFGGLLLLNSAFFVFMLHVLFALFLNRLGMKTSLKLPRWLENAI